MVSWTQENFYTGAEIYLSVRNGSALEFSLTNDAIKNLGCCKIITVRKKSVGYWHVPSILKYVHFLTVYCHVHGVMSFAKLQVFNGLCVLYCDSGLKGHPKSSTCSKSNF